MSAMDKGIEEDIRKRYDAFSLPEQKKEGSFLSGIRFAATIILIIVLSGLLAAIILNLANIDVFSLFKQKPHVNFCQDSDANAIFDYYAKGICGVAIGEHTDYCEGGIAVEYFCAGTEEKNDLHCEVGGYACPSGCENGVCMSECLEKWECTAWADCMDGIMERKCTEMSRCGTEEHKPIEKRSCTLLCADSDGTDFYNNNIMEAGACNDETGEHIDKCQADDYVTDWYCAPIGEDGKQEKQEKQYCVPGGYFCPKGTICRNGRCAEKPSCTEDWQCVEWSLCLNGKQTRKCIEKNNCGTNLTKPIAERSCEVKCRDSDGTSFADNDIKITGVCTDMLGKHTDYCENDGYVNDWYCEKTSNGEPYCVPGGYFCPRGTQCIEGACIKPVLCREEWLCTAWGLCGNNGIRKRMCTDKNECSTTAYKPMSEIVCGEDIKCSEDDNGKNYAIMGKAQLYDYENEMLLMEKQDECTKDGKFLNEYFCENDILSSVKYECPSGCDSGVCD